MAGEYSVGTVPMATAITNYDTAISENVLVRNRVNAEILSLELAWTGVAASKYTGAMETWSMRYSDAIDALRAMHTALTGTQKNYTETDVSQNELSDAVSSDSSGLADVLLPTPGA